MRLLVPGVDTGRMHLRLLRGLGGEEGLRRASGSQERQAGDIRSWLSGQLEPLRQLGAGGIHVHRRLSHVVRNALRSEDRRIH